MRRRLLCGRTPGGRSAPSAGPRERGCLSPHPPPSRLVFPPRSPPPGRLSPIAPFCFRPRPSPLADGFGSPPAPLPGASRGFFPPGFHGSRSAPPLPPRHVGRLSPPPSSPRPPGTPALLAAIRKATAPPIGSRPPAPWQPPVRRQLAPAASGALKGPALPRGPRGWGWGLSAVRSGRVLMAFDFVFFFF